MEQKSLIQRLERLERQADLAAKLDEVSRKLDVVAEMCCPVCGPALVARMHPAGDTQPLEEATASPNGRHR